MSISSSFAMAPKRHTPKVSWPNRNDLWQRHHWWPHALAHPRCLDWLFLKLVVIGGCRILEKIIAPCHSFRKNDLTGEVEGYFKCKLCNPGKLPSINLPNHSPDIWYPLPLSSSSAAPAWPFFTAKWSGCVLVKSSTRGLAPLSNSNLR